LLTFAEEIVLLNLDDETGKFQRRSGDALGHPFAGAVLMDLALRSKVDADLEKLFVVDATPTGDSLLDEALAMIVASEESHDIGYWLYQLAGRGAQIEAAALARLVERGILRQEDRRVLWVLHRRRYPMIDGHEEMEVKRRLLDVLLSDAIPSPRDAALISLVAACGLVTTILSTKEAEHVEERIRSIQDLDLIGHAMNEAVRRLREALALAQASGIGFQA
jgi:hypothetical protein